MNRICLVLQGKKGMQSISNKHANNKRIILAYRGFFKAMLVHPVLGIATYLMYSSGMFNFDTANNPFNSDFNLANSINIQNTVVFVCLLVLCHALLVTRFFNIDKNSELSSWGRYCTISMCVFGLIYAAIFSYLALIIGQPSFLFLTLILTTLFSIVGFIMAASKSALLAFAVPLVLSVGFVFVSSQTIQGYANCAFLVIYLGFAIKASWQMCETITNELAAKEESKEIRSKLTTTEAKLNGLVVTDKITGIYTRQFFERQFVIEYRRAKRASSPLSVIIAEIDYFAEYEVDYGTKQSEKTFSAIANVLKSITKRPGEIVSIYNNKAFVFLLPNVLTEDAEKFANIVQSTVLELAFPHKKSKIPELSIVSLSTGVAELKGSAALCRDDLLKHAESTLKPAHLTGAMDDTNPINWFTFGAKESA